MSKYTEFVKRARVAGVSEDDIAQFVADDPELSAMALGGDPAAPPAPPTRSEAFNARRQAKHRELIAGGAIAGAPLDLPPPPANSGALMQPPSAMDLVGGTGGAVWDAAKGAWDWTGGAIGGMVGGMADTFMAAPAAGKVAYGMYPPALLGQMLVEGVVGGVKSEATKAGELYDQPGVMPKVSATGHALASMLPMVGPGITELGEDLGAGESNKALGKVGTMFLPGIGRSAKAKGSAIKSSLREKLYSASEDAPTSPIRQAIESTHPGKMVFEPLREQQYQARYTKAVAEFRDLNEGFVTQTKEVIRKMGDPDTPKEAVGQQVATAIAGDNPTSYKGATQEMYKVIDDAIGSRPVERTVDKPVLNKDGQPLLDASGKPFMLAQPETVMAGGLPVSLKPMAKQFREVVARLNEQSSVIDPPGLNALRSQAADILRMVEDPTYTPTYSQLRQTNTLMMDIARKGEQLLPKLSGKLTNEIINTFRQATEAAVAEAAKAGTIPEGIPKLLREANERYTLLHQEGVVELLDLAKNDPQAAHRILINPKTPVQHLRDIHTVVGDEAFRAMAVRGLADEWAASIREFNPLETTNSSGAAEMVTGKQLGPQLERTITLLDRSGNLAELFPDTMNELRQLAAIARRSKSFKPGSVPERVTGKPTTPAADNLTTILDKISNTVTMSGFGLMGGVPGFMHGGLGGIGTGAMIGSGVGFTVATVTGKAVFKLAQLMTTKPTAKLVLNYERALSGGNQAAIDAAAMRMMAAVEGMESAEQSGMDAGGMGAAADIYPPPPPPKLSPTALPDAIEKHLRSLP